MPTRRAVVGGAVAISAAGLLGCRSSASTQTGTGAGSASAAPPSAGFPARVETKFGTVVVPAAPKRVVALGWGDAEACLAVGVQPVGASDWLDFGGDGVGPWASGRYTSTPTIIGTLEPSYEQVARLAPDLILDIKSSGDARRHQLLSAIAPTIGVPTGGDNYLVTREQQATMIGQALGQSTSMNDLLSAVTAKFATARSNHPQWKDRTVTVASRTSEGWGAYVKGSERVQFAADLGFVQNPAIDALPAGQSGFSVPISAEKLELLDADLLICFPIYVKPEQVTTDSLYKRLGAVKQKRSIVLDSDIASAYSLAGVLSIDWALDRMLPLLDQANQG